MARANGAIQWYKDAMYQAVDDVAYPIVRRAAELAEDRANDMSADFRTSKWHDHTTGETKGNTQPKYGSKTKFAAHYHHGIVYTENYAAMKDNKEHNTLLKAVPHV